MSLRNVALVGWGLGALACGREIFDLDPLDGGAVALPAGMREPPAAGQPSNELRAGAGEELAPAGASGTLTPASSDAPGALPRPGTAGDVAAAPDGGRAAPGCSKLDFLFVIDNSLSMFQEQSNLAASFPGFMRVVSDTLQVTDHHIMVIDTDGWDGEGAELDSEQCEDTLGAGKRASSVGADCGIEGAQRYILQGQPNLADVFSCTGQVGTFGDFGEQPVDAMLRALSAAENGPAGCNTGFSRDDALLVVVLVTDEDDTRSAGDAEQWQRALLDAKAGNDRAVVVLGLLGDDNVEGGLPGGPCPRLGATGAVELQRFVRSMPFGSLASVCAENYAPFLEQAVTSIRSACDELGAPLR